MPVQVVQPLSRPTFRTCAEVVQGCAEVFRKRLSEQYHNHKKEKTLKKSFIHHIREYETWSGETS